MPGVTRETLADAHRVVVKVGSSSLTGDDGRLDVDALRALSDVLAARRAAGRQVVLVSSGAIAAGLGPLGMTGRPRDLATAQAAASVGQGLLMARYTEAFARRGQRVGQVLLTVEDVMRRAQYRNALRTLDRLLDLDIMPIVNENDTTATHEIRFGDNDRLAAIVSHLTRADALVLLSDVDALYTAPPGVAGARRIDRVTGPQDLAEVRIGGAGSRVGTGGMATKLDAAAIATGSGIPVMLTSAANVAEALDGAPVGTWFAATGSRKNARRLWLAHAARPNGRVVLDDGAVRAITVGKKSLLAAGITGVEGEFDVGDVVELVSTDGLVVARGLVAYSSAELPPLLGKSSAALRDEIGHDREVVHRDHLAVVRHRR
ncbi:glutamate 5-kinase [Isoptericola sp. b441]|uniref:Glutamate 5-kinase n=1 Tax=Actinotalea lenta TaxID=3064654 RepID=A0ABT9DC22_9CELL|nr:MULTISPECIES: glutamate 5-kinase [unclassified Isoptericola]MDO8108145.1 glutamate 5-kinase [Isoptericola sp. b441]MDO8120184.1 glutamate 5-kinase [Isoptericola sp. b490]